MKKGVFILSILFLLIACKKEKIDSKGFGTMGCYNAYEKNSTPIDLSVYDSVKWFWDNGCMTMEPLSADTMLYNVVVNPSNPYEFIYSERLSQQNPEYYLYKYNICTGTKDLLCNAVISLGDRISWGTNGNIYFIYGAAGVKRINSDGSNLVTLFNVNLANSIKCNPNGNFFALTFSNYPSEDSIKIYTKNGNLLYVLPDEANLLGWYDNSHILANLNNKVMRVNVFTGEQNLFLTGSYYSYDYKTHRFLKPQDSLEYRKWILTNESGGITNETSYHYSVGSFRGVKMRPVFGLNNKLIVNLYTNEFYPDKHTPSCQLFSRNRITVMNCDGTDMRVIDFPE